VVVGKVSDGHRLDSHGSVPNNFFFYLFLRLAKVSYCPQDTGALFFSFNDFITSTEQ
jgi:hypothetical protein